MNFKQFKQVSDHFGDCLVLTDRFEFAPYWADRDQTIDITELLHDGLALGNTPEQMFMNAELAYASQLCECCNTLQPDVLDYVCGLCYDDAALY